MSRHAKGSKVMSAISSSKSATPRPSLGAKGYGTYLPRQADGILNTFMKQTGRGRAICLTKRRTMGCAWKPDRAIR